MWIVITLVLGIGLCWWAVNAGYDTELRGLAGVVLIVASVFCFVFAGVNRYDFNPMVARVEAVRSAVDRLGCKASEDVVGQATVINAELASKKLWNKRWIADPFIPDGIDLVLPIYIPECR